MKGFIKRVLWYFKPLKVTTAQISISTSGQRLAGKTVLITGGNRGLGFDIARKFVDEGADVVITGRNKDSLAEAAQKLGYKYFVMDMKDVEHFTSDISLVRENLFGGKRIDVLINNAGISLHEGNMMNVTYDGFLAQLQTNLLGPYFLAQEFLRQYLDTEDNNASIIFMVSEKGLFCDELPYGLIKSALISLIGGMARRWVRKGVRINGIAPGVTATEMTGYKKDNIYCEYNCSKRAYLPEEVSETAAFLASDLSRCITSEVIGTNMGNHLRCDW